MIKNLKFKTAFFGLFWSKIKKKQGLILNRNKKFALWKCLYFLLKNALGLRYKYFYIFSSYPFGAILDTLPLLWFWFCFFLFFSLITNRRFIWPLGNYFQKNLFFNMPYSTCSSSILPLFVFYTSIAKSRFSTIFIENAMCF